MVKSSTPRRKPTAPTISGGDPSLEKKRELAAEAFRIFQHERADEILMNDWVQDGDLPIPSERFILFIAVQSLGNPEWMALGECDSFKSAVGRIILTAKTWTEDGIFSLVEKEWPFMESDAVMGTAAKWLPVLQGFHHCHLQPTVTLQVGQRALARRLIESLVLRAVLFQDTENLTALSEASGLFRAREKPASPRPNLIASEILGWQSRVRAELGDGFSKAELRAFICEMYPHLAGATDKVWAAAWKIAGWGSGGDRKGKRGKGLGANLAKKLK